jgi:hypothetical protein
MKKIYDSVMSKVKFVAFIAIVCFSFYSGMYIVADKYDTGETQQEKLMASILNAVEDTSQKPIIVIKPEKSLYEHAKYVFVDEPERPVIEFTSDELVDALYQSNENPTWFQTALNGTSSAIKSGWNHTVDGAKWTWDKVTFWKE